MPGSALPRRRWSGRWWLALALLPAAGVAVWWLAQPSATSRWQTVPVVRSDVEAAVAAIGTLQPVRSVDVGAQVSGHVTRLHVQPGDAVKKGQLLAEIDASVLAAAVEAGRAQLDGLRAQLAEARAQRLLAERQHQRQQQMARDQATRLEDVQVAEANRAVADARVVQLQAQIRQTMASLRADEARLGYARLYAPMAGVVTGVEVKEGQTLNATYQTPTVLRIADLARMTVWTDVSEADIARVQAGMPASFATLGTGAEGARRWQGRVRQVLPAPPTPEGRAAGGGTSAQAAAAKAVTYTVLFDVGNPDGALLPQMTAQVRFTTAAARGVLSVPLAALGDSVQADATAPQVRVLQPDGRIATRPVRLGVRSRHQVEVLEGLAEGEQVVTAEHVAAAGPRWFKL